MLLDELGVVIHLIKEGEVLSDESRSSQRFVHGIKVLMARTAVENLGEEASKGLLEKAEQGHWPSVAPIGYRNNRETHRIEVDPERGPLVARLFQAYAAGDVSLKDVVVIARTIGLRHPRSGRSLVKSEIHRILRNPIAVGEFIWVGRRYKGSHEPLIGRELWDRTQQIFEEANRPHYSKHQFAYTGLLTCPACGCAITAERKKIYTYYHCTGGRGGCASKYVREEVLVELLGEVVGRIQITTEQADSIAKALRESQADKEREHRRAVMLQQQRYQQVQQTLDRAYEDRLSGTISEELWVRRSREWELELSRLRADLERRESASSRYMTCRSLNSLAGQKPCSCGSNPPNSAAC